MPRSSHHLNDLSDSVQHAKNQALRFLALRPHSIKETADFLQRKSRDADVISTVIASLIELKFLDDHQFAAWWVDSRSRNNPSGPMKLKTELKQKGVSPEIIQQATSLDYLKLAKAAVTKRSAKLHDADPRIRVRKLQDYLKRRGFTWDHIHAVLQF